jgi:hypothetical protein
LRGEGGGVFFVNREAHIISGGTISGNAAGGSGGGVCFTSNSTGTLTMSNAVISGNTTATNGGGMYVSSSGAFMMSSGTIYGSNEAGSLDGLPLKNTAAGGAAFYKSGNPIEDTIYSYP